MSNEDAKPDCKIPLGGGPGGVVRAVIAVGAAVACVVMAILLADHQSPGFAMWLVIATGPLTINGVRRTFAFKCLAPVLANKKDPAAIAEEADHLAIFVIVLSMVVLIGTAFAWDGGDPLVMQYVAIFCPLGFAGITFAVGQLAKAAAVRYRAQHDFDTTRAHAPLEVPPSMESDGAAQIDRGSESR